MENREYIYIQGAQVPIWRSVDVLVLGAGVAGCAAAIMAARLGARTLVIDSQSMAGGMSTTGLMSHFTGTVTSRLYDEVLCDMAAKNGGARTAVIDPENLKLTYIEMLESAGAELLLYTMACEPLMDGDMIYGVTIQNKDGRQVVRAKVVIDSTGDGDIAARAGAEYVLGRERDGAMQPATLMFKVGGVDKRKAVLPGSFETLVHTERGELQALAKSLLPHPAGHVLLYDTTLPGIITCNMTNAINIDGTSAQSLTEAEIICRKQIPEIVKFLREYVPGFEGCFVVSTASLIGIRETRHFKGLYTLSDADILNMRVFEDWVVRDAQFNFDVHNITGASLDKTGVQAKFPRGVKYTIPYRCLIPEKIRGMLLAGRNISGSHMAHSNYRAMPICLAIGEGAGIAAALAIEKGIDVRDVSALDIQAHLL